MALKVCLRQMGALRWFVALAFVVCLATMNPHHAVAESNDIFEWYGLMHDEMKLYATSGLDPDQPRLRSGDDIRVRYVGFRERDEDEIIRRFPDFPEFRLTHRDYIRREQMIENLENLEDPESIEILNNSGILDPLDYEGQEPINLIFIVNTDLNRPLVIDWDKQLREGAKPADIFAHGSNLMHYVSRAVFSQITTPDILVELGPPMKLLENLDAFYAYRNPLLTQHCAAAFMHFQGGRRRPQFNSATIYSAAQPASDDNIECIVKQVALFLRPASISFDEIAPLKK